MGASDGRQLAAQCCVLTWVVVVVVAARTWGVVEEVVAGACCSKVARNRRIAVIIMASNWNCLPGKQLDGAVCRDRHLRAGKACCRQLLAYDGTGGGSAG